MTATFSPDTVSSGPTRASPDRSGRAPELVVAPEERFPPSMNVVISSGAPAGCAVEKSLGLRLALDEQNGPRSESEQLCRPSRADTFVGTPTQHRPRLDTIP